MRKLILPILLACSLGAFIAHANTKRSTTGTAADVNSVIAAAASGDVIQWPLNASLTYNSGDTVSLSGKWLILDMNGSTITRGTGTSLFFQISNAAGGQTRITSGTLKQAVGSAEMVQWGGVFTNPYFRTDHLTMIGDPTVGSQLLMEFYTAWGLVDHCAFSAPTNSEMLHNNAYGPGDATGWGDDITAGTTDQVIIENNTFTNNDPNLLTTNPAYFFGNSGLQGYYGSRTTMRHNVFFMSQVDFHGGSLGARWFELYSNEFQVIANGNQDKYIEVRSGTGFVYSNTKTGATNLGLGQLFFDLLGGDSATYPPFAGKNEVLTPGYIYSNGSGGNMPIATSYSTPTYYLTSAPGGYVPAAYPFDESANIIVPTSLAAGSPGTTTIPLTWTYTGPALESFTVQISTDNATWTTDGTASAGATSYTSSGRLPGTKYYYRIAAVDSNGTSTFTASVNATTTGGAMPVAGRAPRPLFPQF